MLVSDVPTCTVVLQYLAVASVVQGMAAHASLLLGLRIEMGTSATAGAVHDSVIPLLVHDLDNQYLGVCMCATLLSTSSVCL